MCSHGPAGRFKDSQKPLRAIYRNYLALIRPIFRIIDQRSTHRVLSNVFPFFAHAFITAQDVVKESFLPELSAGPEPAVGASKSLFQLQPTGRARTLRRQTQTGARGPALEHNVRRQC